jgi:FAD/FMN-containing dehydrogenase
MSARTSIPRPSRVERLNDVHSALNSSQPLRLLEPETLWDLTDAVRRAHDSGLPMVASGGRHAMGGQQFCEQGLVLDCRRLNRVLTFDPEEGLIEVEAGIEWPALIEFLQSTPWSIIQKQTGADHLTIGGAVSANIHGRGLAIRPLIQDIEGLTIIDAEGEVLACSRRENASLFRHVVGGYGMFGAVYSVLLRLAPRRVLRRTVRRARAGELMSAFERLIADGFLYGDWQFAIDDTSDDFLDLGILSAYEPIHTDGAVAENIRKLSDSDWRRLLLLAHTDKACGFAEYSRHYLSTHGQLYWSDTHQLSSYPGGYHVEIDAATCARVCGSEMITELAVPRGCLAEFLAAARAHLRACHANVIYGTVRLVERDAETALAWARDRWACIIFNLHVDHEPRAIAKAQDAFRGLIDCALAFGGSYYLTYHRWATRSQVLAAHPSLPNVFAMKLRIDPTETFQSDWYRHHRDLIA